MASHPLVFRLAWQVLREADPPPPAALDGWLADARAGDMGAFTRMRAHIEPGLVGFLRSYLKGDEDTALDVAQETFTVAWRKLDQIRDGEHLRPWLYRVARFKAINHLRRRTPRGRLMLSLDHGTAQGAEPQDPGPADPVRRAITRDPDRPDLAALRKAMADLPSIYAAVFRLYYDARLNTREIAELLALPRTTVKMRLLRGRALLRRKILEQTDGTEPEL